MKTKILSVAFLLLMFVFNVKAQDAYSDKIDSLLVSISKLIFIDLSTDSFKVLQRPYIGFGDSFEFNVIFDTKRSVILTYLHRPESINRKINKRKHQFKYIIFSNYIHDHNELPYDMFDSFSYKFLQVQTKGETLGGDALFGEYRFKATNEGLTIIDKKIEILKGKSAILGKHNSDW